MSYLNQLVSVNSDEKTFIKTFINQLTAADSRITCDTDIDAQFASTSNTPSFTVNFGTNSKIVFTRSGNLTSSSNYYVAKVYINGNNILSKNLIFVSSACAYTGVTARSWKLFVFANPSTLYIGIGSLGNIWLTSIQLSAMAITDGSFSATACADNYKVILSNFYGTDNDHKNLVYIFHNRMSYLGNDGKIEIIKNKALLLPKENNSSKFLTFDGLYDCSYISPSERYKIDKTDYVALHGFTIMPI